MENSSAKNFPKKSLVFKSPQQIKHQIISFFIPNLLIEFLFFANHLKYYSFFLNIYLKKFKYNKKDINIYLLL